MMQESEENNMPTVRDKITGEVVSKQDYDAEGMQIANEMVENNPSLEVSYEAPTNDAMYRNTNMGMDEYMGGGKIKINPMGYQEGGKVK